MMAIQVGTRQSRKPVLVCEGPAHPDLAPHVPDPASAAPAYALRLFGLASPLRARATGVSALEIDITAGEFLLIHGEAGSGKSQMLDLAGLVLRPGAGRLEILGRNPWKLSAGGRARLRRRIGYIRQDLDLIENLSVEENAALPMKIAGVRREVRRRDVAELLGWLGLGEKAAVRPGDLDRDERQRLAVARAVAGRPEIILADEPLGWLGPDAARRVLRLLLQLNRQGVTLMLASRNADLAPASRKLRLLAGQIVSEERS
ncbi:MAG: ATP-binding cassette domain-containing protein [Phenylobacterium sp.]